MFSAPKARRRPSEACCCCCKAGCMLPPAEPCAWPGGDAASGMGKAPMFAAEPAGVVPRCGMLTGALLFGLPCDASS